MGDAGAITTNREDVYDYVREARNHFKGTNQEFGGNYRLDEIQACWLNIRFKDIDRILARRKEIAERYLEELEGIVNLPNNSPNRVWQDFIIRAPERDELYQFLKENGIECMKNEYPFSPAYPKLPKAAKFEAETLRIPCNESMTYEEIEEVIKQIKLFFILF